MKRKDSKIFKGTCRVKGSVEGEALVTTEKLSHLFNAISSDGIIRMSNHPLMGQSYADKIIVYDTDIFSTAGAWGLYFKNKITGKGPKAIICRTAHPISIGGAIDAEIPVVDNFNIDPCQEIKTGDRVKITAPVPGENAIVEVLQKYNGRSFANYNNSSKTCSIKNSNKTLNLTPYETEMLNGTHGKGKQIAMERLVKFGQAVESKRMIKICSAHIFSDWKTDRITIGAWPVYEEFAALNPKVAVPTTIESGFMCEELVDDPGMPWHYKAKITPSEVYKGVKPVIDCLRSIGAIPIPTCIPYMHLSIPKYNEYHVTSESNHAAYINTMVGARINRDPANMVLYAALTGVMPEYGMHLTENRRGQVLFEIEPELLPELQDIGDYVALGGAIGFKAVDRVPVISGLPCMTNEQAKAFCACVSPALTYPMIHIVGVTPGSQTLKDAFGGSIPKDIEKIRIGKKDVRNLYHSIRQTAKVEIDASIIGCPFLTLEEFVEIAKMLEGKKVKKRLWLYTDFIIYSAVKKAGILSKIENSGARVVHSCCPGMIDRDFDVAESLTFATDSLKVATLGAGIGFPKNWLGTRKDVINAALTGRFERTRWV